MSDDLKEQVQRTKKLISVVNIIGDSLSDLPLSVTNEDKVIALLTCVFDTMLKEHNSKHPVDTTQLNPEDDELIRAQLLSALGLTDISKATSDVFRTMLIERAGFYLNHGFISYYPNYRFTNAASRAEAIKIFEED